MTILEYAIARTYEQLIEKSIDEPLTDQEMQAFVFCAKAVKQYRKDGK